MFASNPTFAFSVPAPLGDSSCSYWKALEVISRVGWFIVTIRDSVPEGEGLSSFICCWDHDLVDAIERAGRRKIVSLQFMHPTSEDPTKWATRDLRSVWRGTDTSSGQPVVIFEDALGNRFESQYECPVEPSIVIGKLVATFS